MTDKFEALHNTTKAAGNTHVEAADKVSGDVMELTKAELELRKKAIDGMDEQLLAIYEQEVAAYKDHRGDIVSFNYDRGTVASEVNRNPKYGTAAVDLLSTALGLDRSTMYKTMRFSNMYTTKSDLESTLTDADKRGVTLTWSHFVAVLSIPETEGSSDPHEDRRRMLDTAVENKMSVRALSAEVKLVYGNNTATKVNTARANVKSLFKQLSGGNTRFAVKLKTKAEELINDFDEAVETGSAEDVKGYMERALALKSSLDEVIDLVGRVKNFIDKFPGKITSAVAERKKVADMRDDSDTKKSKVSK
jgi:hypothetical protein